MLAARSDIPMTKEKFPDAEQASPELSLFVVERDRYYSRYSDQCLGAAIIFGKFQFSKLQMWKNVRVAFIITDKHRHYLFCSRVPKCKTEIVAVSISDSVSAQFARSRGYFFILNRLWECTSRKWLFTISKKSSFFYWQKLGGLLTHIRHVI